MGAFDVLWHLLNLVATGVLAAAVAAALARVLWWRALSAISWWRLAWPACTVAASVQVLGLLLGGRDGLMVTYAAMIAATAFTLWWRGWAPARRRGSRTR